MNKQTRKELADLAQQFQANMETLQQIIDHEQEKYDNIPDGLTETDRAQAMADTISALEDAYSSIEDAVEVLLSPEG